MQEQLRSSSWDQDFPDDELLTDQMAAPKKEEGEPDLVEDKSVDEKPASDVESGALAEKTAEPMQTDSEMEAATKEADDSQENTKNLFKMWTHKSVAGLDSPSTPSEDKSGDVKPAPDVAAGANTDQTPQKPVQTDSKKGDDSQGDTRNLFKMWSQKSVRGLDSGRPAPGVPRRARSSITAPTAEEEPSPAATDATPPKPGSLVVHGLEAHLGEELQQLLKDIKRCGEKGEPTVKFGELFDDPEVEQYYEALVGTLKNAKKRGLISFEGQMLLKGVHDNVLVSIVKP